MPLLVMLHMPDHTADDAEFVPGELFQGKIVGIFNYPARRELADHPNCFLNGKQPWIRDRAGFMKCGVCGKRNKRVRRFLLEALFDFLGANLYPGAPGAFRTPEGYGDSTR